ncbi:MAG: alpha/beta fold hydrolase [Sphingomonas sp.]
MAGFDDRYWQSADGLKLHYRDYAGGDGRPPILCIPGLTRNARDFEEVAARLAGVWRVLCVDLRGRGDSHYAKDPATYNPLTYAEDVLGLIDELSLTRVIAFGTSLGGLVTMLLAARASGRLAGALLNDVGPEIDPAGLARIRSYVGKSSSFSDMGSRRARRRRGERRCLSALRAERLDRDGQAALLCEQRRADRAGLRYEDCRAIPRARR